MRGMSYRQAPSSVTHQNPLQLTATFLSSSNRPQGCWTVIGLGLRMAQDVGAHRKKMYGATPSVDDELWRRAVWYVHEHH